MLTTKSHAAQFITNKIIPKKQLAEKLKEDKLKGDTVYISGLESIFFSICLTFFLFIKDMAFILCSSAINNFIYFSALLR